MASTTNENVFKGFSTAGATITKNWTLRDIELIKRDLANHFGTRIGERVMRPTFGCAIWDYLMEQLTSGMRDQIAREAIRVCEADPRVSVQNVVVVSIPKGVQVQLTLLFNPYQVVDTFIQNFNSTTDY